MTVAFGSKVEDDFKLERAIVQKATISGTGKTYYPARPGYNTSVTLNKNGSTATLKSTNDFTRGENVDDAEFSSIERSTGTVDYQKGHNAGLTGFEVDCTAFAGAIEVIILQYKVENNG